MAHQVWVVLRRHGRVMGVRGQDLVENPTRRPRWDREDAEAQVDDINVAAIIELPAMTYWRRQRHLSGR